MKLASSLEDLTIAVMATSICKAYYAVKRNYLSKKESEERARLADAHYEFNYLHRALRTWKVLIRSTRQKKLWAQKIAAFRERWSIVHLFTYYSAFNFVCSAHKHWVEQVQLEFLYKRAASSLKDWKRYSTCRTLKRSLRTRQARRVLSEWRNYHEGRKRRIIQSYLYWYRCLMVKSVLEWKCHTQDSSFKKRKLQRAQFHYRSRIICKVFYNWVHSKALAMGNYIPIKISTTKTITRQQGKLHEKSSVEIQIGNRITFLTK